MCGSLRHLKRDRVKMLPQQEWERPGGKFRCSISDGAAVIGTWDGFAREETLSAWTAKGWKCADLLVSGYSENNVPYEVPDGYVLRCVVARFNGKYVFRIVTREAVGAERDVHSRFPCMRKRIHFSNKLG